MEIKTFATLFLACLCFETVRSATHDVLTLCKDKGWADGIYPHPTNCTMFIECSGQVTSELDCPSNLIFNPDLNVCDDPGNVVGGSDCAQTTPIPTQDTTTPRPRTTTFKPMTTVTSTLPTTTPPTTTMPTTMTSIPSTTTPTTTTTMPTTTTTTRTTTTTMPTTTTTTPTTTTTMPTTTTTAPTTTTTIPTTTTTMPTTTTTMPTTTTTMPTTTTTTPMTTTPTPVTTTAIPTTTSASGKPTPSTIDITNLCVDENLRNGIHPDPTSCIHFIECSFGRTFRMDCPIGLAFNSQALTCDDRFNVDCGDNYNYIIG